MRYSDNIKFPEDLGSVIKDINRLERTMEKLNLDKDLSFNEIRKKVEGLKKDQYITKNMIKTLEGSIYPPHFIIQRIKELSPRDPDFKILLVSLRSACFRTSTMWKQSNTDVFDFLHSYKEIK